MSELGIKPALLLALAAGLLQGGPLVNGSFEDPAIGSFQQGLVGTGWQIINGAGVFLETYGAFHLPTAGGAGNQAQGFGANGVTGDRISQAFDTTPGDVYRLSFQFVTQQGPEFESLIADVLDGSSNVLNTDTETFNSTAWVTKTFTFTATTASSTVRFTDNTGNLPGNLGNGTNWALDAVTVSDLSSTATPEPSSVALFGLGFFGMAARRRRAAKH